MELLQVFEMENVRVETYYNGTDKLPNKFYLDGKLIYEDDTFRPSPLNNIDDYEVMVSLMDFNITTRNDVEEGFFKDRQSTELLEWAENSDLAEEIKMMCLDFYMDKDERKTEGMTKKECKRIKKYITNH